MKRSEGYRKVSTVPQCMLMASLHCYPFCPAAIMPSPHLLGWHDSGVAEGIAGRLAMSTPKSHFKLLTEFAWFSNLSLLHLNLPSTFSVSGWTAFLNPFRLVSPAFRSFGKATGATLRNDSRSPNLREGGHIWKCYQQCFSKIPVQMYDNVCM